MPPLPKRRWSTHRQGKKRKSLGIKTSALVTCPNCGQLTLPHRVCPGCGYYKGKEVVQSKIKSKVTRRRGKEKETRKKKYENV